MSVERSRDNSKSDNDNSPSREAKPDRPNIGFEKTFPKDLIRKLDVKLKFEPKRIPHIVLSRQLLINSVPDDAQVKENFDFADWITKVNDVTVESREQYYEEIARLNKLDEPQMVRWSIRRTMRGNRIEDAGINKLIPAGTEIQPGYGYFLVCITLHRGSTLGLNIKSYNSKVYVTATDNSFNCASFRSLSIGDAILSVEKSPVSTVADASSKMRKVLKLKHYMLLVVERAESIVALRQVRTVIHTNKTREIDPRMPNDVVEICRQELKRLRAHKDEMPADIMSLSASSQKSHRSKKKRERRVQVMKTPQEVNIGTNPINPLLLQKVPPRP